MISLTFSSSKGGVGKTTTSCVVAYLLAKRHNKRVLVVDGDLQHNATSLLLRTSQNINGKMPKLKNSLMKAIADKDISESLVHIMPKLDLIGNSDDFRHYPRYLEQHIKNYNKRIAYFWMLLQPLAEQYDFVIIDCPPSESFAVSSFLFGTMFSVPLLQANQYGYEGVLSYLHYMQSLIDEFKSIRLDFLGILPVMVDNSATCKHVLDVAYKQFKGSIFPDTIPKRQRLDFFSITGITDTNGYSKDALDSYNDFVNDMLLDIESKTERI